MNGGGDANKKDMEQVQAKSKGTWGRRVDRSKKELNVMCGAFFDGLQVPNEWKLIKWDKTEEPPPIGITSIGIIFMDTRTRGIDIMHYRVMFHTFSERGGVCEKSMKDFGKYAYKSVDHGIFTVEKLNEFIHDRYFELTTPPNAMGHAPLSENELHAPLSENELHAPLSENELHDKDDGLQHFRDKFSD